MYTTPHQPKEVHWQKRRWYVVDAQHAVLGRLAVQIANLLRGKQKPTFSYHVDAGDYVVVINAAQVRLSGNKLQRERWYWHSHYVGGIKSRLAWELIAKHPDQVIYHAVRLMLPKNPTLSHQLLKKLRVYAGETHPHGAQTPKLVNVMV